MRSFAKIGLFCLLTSFVYTSCHKNVITQATSDDNIIKNYLSTNHLTATKTGDALYYIITKQGTGAVPTASSFITVAYTGSLSTGAVFDSNQDFETSMASTILGWQEGLTYFKKGGSGMLLIPSALGYSATATGNVPANSVLIFTITLIDVK